jgi:beta-glucanase (GH16 family)
MKKAFYVIAFLFAAGAVRAQVMWQIKKDTIIKWYYYDGDEFNGPEIDRAKWRTSYSYTEVNYPLDFYMTPKRILFENGICKFTCDRDTGLYQVPGWQLDSAFKKQYQKSLVDGDKFKYFFSSGVIRSNRPYGKGYFEIRFKHDDSYGMWPAFWLFGKQKDEIDFFELKGERNKDLHVDVHCPKGCDHGYRGGSLFPKTFGGWIKTTENLKDGFNIVSGEWQDGYVKWYLNGEGIAYFKGDFATEKMHLIIGTGPGKDGEPFSPGVNKTSYFPNSLDVDYVRIWYKTETDTGIVLGKKHEKFNFYNADDGKPAKLKRKIRYMYNKKELKSNLLTVSVMPSPNKKVIITSHGENINYKITFYDMVNKEILSRNIIDNFEEVDFSSVKDQTVIKLKLEFDQRKIEESIQLK